MSLYRQLCSSYLQALDEAGEYAAQGREGLLHVLTGFARYLDAPDGNISFAPLETDDEAHFSMDEAVKWRDDGWWESYAELTLHPHPGTEERPQVLRIPFRLFVEERHCTVQVGDLERRFTVTRFEESELVPVYDAAFAMLKSYLEEGIQRLIDQNRPVRKRTIGFVHG